MGIRLEQALGVVFAAAMTAATGYFTIVWPALHVPASSEQAVVLAGQPEGLRHVDAARAQPVAMAQDVPPGDGRRVARSDLDEDVLSAASATIGRTAHTTP